MSETHRFVVIGAGGIGSWLCPALARMLEFRAPGSGLVIVDGDNYEPKNLERQVFSQIGNKAVVLASDLGEEFEKTFIIPIGQWVVAETPEGTEVDEDGNEIESSSMKIAAKDLLEEGDVVFAVVDNDAARKVLFDAAAEIDNIDVFSGGNNEEMYGSVYHYRRRDGKDVSAHPAEYHPQYMEPADRNPGDMSCEERARLEGGTQLIAANMGVTTMILGRVQATIIEDGAFEEQPHEVYFDLALGMAQGAQRFPVEGNAGDEEEAEGEILPKEVATTNN